MDFHIQTVGWQGYKIGMELSDVGHAFAALEELDQLKGQARNQRLELLMRHRDNCELKTVFRLATDWRLEFGVLTTGMGVSDGNQTFTVEDSWRAFLDLIEVFEPSRLLTNRKRLASFLEDCHPLVGKWALRVLDRDLGIYLSTKLLAKIWGTDVCVPFQVPPLTISRPDAVRTFIFVHDGKPVTYTANFRKFNTANDCFGKQIARIQNDCVIEGWVTSNDWALTQSLLTHHASTLSKGGFKSLYYGLRFEAVSFYHGDNYYRGDFRSDRHRLVETVASLHKRTSITLSQASGFTREHSVDAGCPQGAFDNRPILQLSSYLT
jgi:hypothetical protein